MRRRGYTLIEVLVACCVGTLLVGLTVPILRDASGQAKYKRAQAELATIAMVEEQIFTTFRRYTDDLEDLTSTTAPEGFNPSQWQGPYVKSVIDPWGRPYLYATASVGETIVRFGPQTFSHTQAPSPPPGADADDDDDDDDDEPSPGFGYAILAGGKITCSGSLNAGSSAIHTNSQLQVTGGGTITTSVATACTEVKMTGSSTISGDTQAPSYSLSGASSITGTQTTAAVASVPIPNINMTPYYNHALANGEVYYGNQSINGSGTYAPTGGIMYVNGNLHISGSKNLTGCFIATGSIQDTGTGTHAKAADYPALVSTGGSISLGGGRSFHGLVYAPFGSVSGSGSSSHAGSVICSGTFSKSGSWTLTFEDSEPTPPEVAGDDDDDDDGGGVVDTPTVSTTTFGASVGAATLTLVNEAPAITAGSVSLNGAQVVSSAQLAGGATPIQVQVSLQTSNTLEVSLSGATGNMSIRIDQTVATPHKDTFMLTCYGRDGTPGGQGLNADIQR